jgi:hypothetical protein
MRPTVRPSLLFAAVLLTSPALLSAQDVPTGGQPPLRVFLDCGRCDFDYMREEVPVVDYVRDRQVADVHVLVTTQDTGGGGEEYIFNFIGLGALAGRADTLSYVSQQVQTEDEQREGYTQTFGLGLVRYLVYSGRTSALEIDFGDADEQQQTLNPADDPWNLWVFEIDLSAELQGESQRKETLLEGSFEAGRTTQDFKIEIEARGEYEELEFERDDETQTRTTRDLGADALAVWSIGPNWSWGFSGAIGTDQSVNQELYTQLAPALEYSFYPYTESTRRAITATYRVGGSTFYYEERTVFNQISEIRPFHSLELSADFQQPWGELNTSIEGSHFLDDPDRHRIDVFSRLEIRLFRGVDLNIQGNYARVRDQIYLSAAGLDPDEILIGQRELNTDYEYGIEVGLGFTFGSIFNNVVNPRLGGDGGGDFN